MTRKLIPGEHEKRAVKETPLAIWRREGRPWLLERMRLRGWNQADLAREMGGVPQATISRWVNAQTAPNAAGAATLARVFGVDVDTVLVLTGRRPRQEEENQLMRQVVATMRLLPPEYQQHVADQAEYWFWAWQRDRDRERMAPVQEGMAS